MDHGRMEPTTGINIEIVGSLPLPPAPAWVPEGQVHPLRLLLCLQCKVGAQYIFAE